MKHGFARRQRRPMVCVALLLGPVAAGASRAMAQEPVVQTELDRTRATVGDHLTLTITVEHDSTETIGWTEAPDDLEPFEVLRFSALPSSRSNSHVVSRAQYVLTVFELGDLEIPSIEASLTGEGTAESRVLATDPLPVSVMSVQPDSADIVDIKAPLTIARNWLLLAPWAVALLLAAAIGYWSYRWYRTRVTPAAPVLAAPPRPAHIVANEALDRLEAAGLLERGEIKQYFVAVSEIMRAYVEARYGIDAMELTSLDIEAGLRERGVQPRVLERFSRFHRRCDLVKFAKLRPDVETSRGTVPLARELIRLTCSVETAAGTAGRTVQPEPAVAVTNG